MRSVFYFIYIFLKVEGYPTAAEVTRLAKENNLRLPLFAAVDAILSGKVTPEEAFSEIMGRAPDLEMPELHVKN
tara:strand:- start:296 stop:517 length:222 start_codon:yes stop_codon:yes gene_type:complete